MVILGGGHTRAMMKLVVPLYFVFLATAVGDLPQKCPCLECGTYFRRHLFLLVFPPRTSCLICSGSITRTHFNKHCMRDGLFLSN